MAWFTGYLVFPDRMVPVCQSMDALACEAMLCLIPSRQPKEVHPGRFYFGTEVNRAVTEGEEAVAIAMERDNVILRQVVKAVVARGRRVKASE